MITTEEANVRQYFFRLFFFFLLIFNELRHFCIILFAKNQNVLGSSGRFEIDPTQMYLQVHHKRTGPPWIRGHHECDLGNDNFDFYADAFVCVTRDGDVQRQSVGRWSLLWVCKESRFSGSSGDKWFRSLREFEVKSRIVQIEVIMDILLLRIETVVMGQAVRKVLALGIDLSRDRQVTQEELVGILSWGKIYVDFEVVCANPWVVIQE